MKPALALVVDRDIKPENGVVIVIDRVASIDPVRRARLAGLLRKLLDNDSTPDDAGKP